MNRTIESNRLKIRRLIACAGGMNPRLKSQEDQRVLDLLVDFKPGVGPATILRLQTSLELALHMPVYLDTPRSLSARERASVLGEAVAL